MNIQNVKNETLMKLTAKEIGELGLLNYGVMTYKGVLKQRVKNFKTVKVSEKETWFTVEDEGWRVEFIEIQAPSPLALDDEKHFAMRNWNEQFGYNEHLAPLAGLPFLR